MKIVALCGSLRKASCNMGILRHCKESLASKGVKFDIVSSELLGSLPLMNEDLENKGNVAPEGVNTFCKQIHDADAFVIATCEYNAGYSAALKNGLDWASRTPPYGNIWNNKPVSIVGAGGYGGTSRAQIALRDVLYELNMKNMNGSFGSGAQIRIQIKHPGEEPPFDDNTGDLVSDFWKGELDNTMDGLIKWTKRIKED
jgi:chromate reductase, NAD(P)H dehydrogenase (quinone)